MDKHVSGIKLESWLVSAGRPSEPGAPLNAALVPASNFIIGAGRDYSRDDGTPTWEALEDVVDLWGDLTACPACGWTGQARLLQALPAEPSRRYVAMKHNVKGVTGSPGRQSMIAGMDVREEDVESQKGLHIAVIVIRAAAVVILLLALVQFGAWWLDRPPGGVGVGLLVGDTIRLIVVASLLWAGGELAGIMTRTHDDVRIVRILLARQTHMMRQMGITTGGLRPSAAREGQRREDDA